MVPHSILRGFALITLFTLAALSVFRMPLVPQSMEYLQFADQTRILGIPHFWDVTSNFLFLVSGFLGLRLLREDKNLAFFEPEESKGKKDQAERKGYFLLFSGLIATCIGSVFFHLDVSLERLVWDRVPIVFVFVTFYSLIVYERVGPKWGKATWFFFMIYALGSVFYWHHTELQGQGDMRAYILVQFFPITTIPIMLIFFPGHYDRVRDIVLVMVAYGVAKGAEVWDHEIYDGLGGLMSGHTLKHLIAGLGTLVWVRYLKRRRVLQNLYPKYF